MNKKWEDLISNELCVKPIKINSSILTGQNRERLYWTNIPNVEIPEDKNIKLKDILDENVEDKYYLNDKQIQKAQYLKGKKEIKRIKNGFEYIYKEGGMSFPNDLNKKSNCLLASGQSIARTSTYIEDEKGIRKITPTECEKLQTVPIGYTEGVSDAQRYKMIGNGWTVDVISHILKNIKNN
jgi:site-specific DNA-cytosine methylase